MNVINPFLSDIALKYHEFISETPYCSISAYYKLAGHNVNEKFGGNCLYQSELLQTKLQESETFFVRDGRQFSLIVKENNKYIYLNPYLLQENPICFDINNNEAQNGLVKSYPHVNYENKEFLSKISYKFSPSEEILSIEKMRYSINEREYKSSKFSYNLTNKIIKPPKHYGQSFIVHPEQTSLSIRIFDETTKSLSHLIYPLNKPSNRLNVSKKNLLIKTMAGLVINYNNQDFLTHAQLIAAKIDSSTKDLIDFIIEGVNIYNSLVPYDIKYKSTNPVNQ